MARVNKIHGPLPLPPWLTSTNTAPSSPAMVDLNKHALLALDLSFKVFAFINHESTNKNK